MAVSQVDLNHLDVRAALDALLNAVQQKRRAILKNDVAAIQESTNGEMQASRALNALDLDWAKLAESDADTAAEILSMVRRIQAENSLNNRLLQESLAVVQFSLDAISGEHARSATYSADLVGQTPIRRLSFERTA